ncbi:MAG: DUF6089 family protein [Bacteroidetes bacterium]|nr:DUF6089 family protein [Bacteroidota bacterium]
MVKRFLFISLVLSSSFIFPIYSQSFFDWKIDRLMIPSFTIGNAGYTGELNGNDQAWFGPTLVGLGFQYKIYNRFNARGELNFYHISGDDADGPENSFGKRKRNLSFTSNNLELVVLGMYDLIFQGGAYYERSPIIPYIFAGIGVTYANPKGKLDGKKYALRPIMTEGVKYTAFQLVLPSGIGVKYKVNYLFDLALEITYRFTFTDYLDDVSGFYTDPGSFDEIGRQLADRRSELGLDPAEAGDGRGNPDIDDGYGYINLRLNYYLPKDFFKKAYPNKPKIAPFRKFKKKLHAL